MLQQVCINLSICCLVKIKEAGVTIVNGEATLSPCIFGTTLSQTAHMLQIQK